MKFDPPGKPAPRNCLNIHPHSPPETKQPASHQAGCSVLRSSTFIWNGFIVIINRHIRRILANKIFYTDEDLNHTTTEGGYTF